MTYYSTIFVVYVSVLVAILFKVNKDMIYFLDVYPDRLPDESEADYKTRKLIGTEAYTDMLHRVAAVLRSHLKDRYVKVTLTSGADSPEGENELHHLLPGDPLHLSRYAEDGAEYFDVYSRGFRVGRLMFDEAEAVSEIFRASVITGVYVAEQNSYGPCPTFDLTIAVFHSMSQSKPSFLKMANAYKSRQTSRICRLCPN